MGPVERGKEGKREGEGLKSSRRKEKKGEEEEKEKEKKRERRRRGGGGAATAGRAGARPGEARWRAGHRPAGGGQGRRRWVWPLWRPIERESERERERRERE